MIDKQGRVRASLSTNDRGDPSLDLLDNAGKVDASLASGQRGPVLDLEGPDPWSSAYLGIPNGKPILALSGDGREGRVILGYEVDGDVLPSEIGHWGITLNGANGKRMALGISMVKGKEYGAFAELPKKEAINFPLSPPEPPVTAK